MEKRGQVTIFIIAGIVILILAGLFFFIQRTTVERRFTPASIPAVADMPFTLQPLRLYTEDCIAQTAKEAFRKLGDGGGYIDASEFEIRTSDINPTEADGVKFSPGSNLGLPYWRYLKSSNSCAGDCQFSSLRPALERTGDFPDSSIEAQVDSYVDENLKFCLDDYASFIAEGFSVDAPDEVHTTIFIEDKDVSVFVEYPVDFVKGDTRYHIERFFVSLPLSFKRIYNLASGITESEVNYTFLESQALNVISDLTSLDEESLPPKTEATFDFAGGTIWSKTQVEKNIEGMLTTYVGAIQVPFSLNHEQRNFGDDITTGVYLMDAPVNLNRAYDDLAVRFDYLGWWPLYFDLNCNGDVCEPLSANNPFLTFVGFQQYDFVYDVSFPVVVDITDPAAFDGQGYSFKLALEANIRNNQALDADFPGYVGIQTKAGSLLCDSDMRNSGSVVLNVKDRLSGKGLQDVQVMYSCGDTSCSIGETDENGDLVTAFPVCFGGIVSFVDPDYFIPAQALNTKVDREEFVAASGWPFVDKEITVRKWHYALGQDQLGSMPVDLEQDEEIFLSLRKIPEYPGETSLETGVDFSGSQQGASQLQRLVPGSYHVEGNMIFNRRVVIPEETRKTGAVLFGLLGEEEYTLPEIVFEDGYPSGGVILNGNTGYLEITPEDLYNNREIVFYAIGPSLPEHVEDLNQDIELLSSRFRDRLDPDYVK